MRVQQFILLLFTAATVSASMEFKVRVLNGSQDSSALGGIGVDLLQFSPSVTAPLLVEQKTTNTDGYASFSTVALDSHSNYFFSASYSGVRYYSKKFISPAAENKIIVFDTTSDFSALSIPMHHLIAEKIRDRLLIRETRVVQNSGSKTMAAYENEPLMAIPLPAGFSEFSPITQDFDLTVRGDTLVVSGVVPPGKQTLSFSYMLALGKQVTRLAVHFPAPTFNFDLFFFANGLQPVSAELQDLGDFPIRGKTYRRYHGEGFAGGRPLSITLRQAEQTGETLSPFLTMGIAAVLLAASFFYSRLSVFRSENNPKGN